ncbi:hypothetical protein Pst134EA_030306 [Puccinia striiformis f. sp. tritici]|uniref:hypothetical protein n=1 Tax=Puccinia striiformis f. sp. tritici TaxID=168172 RepID=UPI002008B5E9|nr:hypothetical protein Pst134EA_030306 [Puccinia striiformis f. sp. tritici]KAH9446386.1 hypothetical protein Pst134EA_030306 [Puccinia striiformis f. sp. tritici]
MVSGQTSTGRSQINTGQIQAVQDEAKAAGQRQQGPRSPINASLIWDNFIPIPCSNAEKVCGLQVCKQTIIRKLM